LWTRAAIVALSATLLSALPCVAFAASASAVTSQSTQLEFTLPTEGKSGCLVCHGDPNLVKMTGETTQNAYIDVEQLQKSAHAEEVCTGCHIDFAYTSPHSNTEGNDEWVSVAKLACKNCKQHTTQFQEFSIGVHSPAGTPSAVTSGAIAARQAEGKPTTRPLCGDCHPAHSIPSKDDTPAVEAYRMDGLDICGSCHTGYSDTYVDYYHGAAYRNGAADAPACWDCHGKHEIYPTKDRRSAVNERNLIDTCGQEGCHVNAEKESEQFLDYAQYVHGKPEAVAELPTRVLLSWISSGVQGAIDTVSSWFDGG
jgi:hypothetical protein